MHAFTVLLLLCLFGVVWGRDCPLVPETAGDRRQNQERLRVATFNTYWLFDGVDDPDLVPWESVEEAEEHTKLIAKVVEDMDADILVLQEVESCAVVESMVSHISFGDQYRVYMIRGTDTATGQNVALVTRVDPSTKLFRTSARVDFPVSGSGCGYNGNGNTAVSKHFFTLFNIPLPGDASEHYFPLLLTSMHFRAFPTRPNTCAQREGQATVLRNQLQAMVSDYYNKTLPGIKYEMLRGFGTETENSHPPITVIAAGDMNDYDDLVPDIDGNTPTSIALRLLRESDSKFGLTNVASNIDQQPERFSNWFDRNRNGRIDKDSRELSMIDHILVSNHSVGTIGKVEVRWDLYWDNLSISDHWPVVLDFDLSTAVPSDNESTSGSNSCVQLPWLIVCFLVLLCNLW